MQCPFLGFVFCFKEKEILDFLCWSCELSMLDDWNWNNWQYDRTIFSHKLPSSFEWSSQFDLERKGLWKDLSQAVNIKESNYSNLSLWCVIRNNISKVKKLSSSFLKNLLFELVKNWQKMGWKLSQSYKYVIFKMKWVDTFKMLQVSSLFLQTISTF